NTKLKKIVSSHTELCAFIFQVFRNMLRKNSFLTDFNQSLQDEFSEYLITDLDLSKNSHSKYVMVLSQVIKYAVKKKLLPASLMSELKFSTSREETDNIYLNQNEIQLLMDLKKFKKNGEEEVRDM